METKFNFNSQICTSKIQSERLLALGLKKETADMFWWDNGYGSCAVISRPSEKEDGEYGKVIPAWSLHRLMILAEMKGSAFLDLDVAYETTISVIAAKIRFGYFNKEYLENGNC